VLPCSCPYDRHRGLRSRLRAEVATDAEQDRLVMRPTSSKRCGFPIPMHWLHAGGDLGRPSHVDQCADCLLTRPKRPANCPLHWVTIPCVQACSWRRPSIAPVIEIGTDVKSR
jgi:hypothetical protein